jgi:hypothetical protein
MRLFLQTRYNIKIWILILIFCAQGCTVLKNRNDYKWTIMDAPPPAQVEKLQGHLQVFFLTKLDRKEVEQILKEVYASEYEGQFESSFPLSEFCRQYYAFVNLQNERIVFVQCYHRSIDRDDATIKNYLPVFNDGCESVFRVHINLDSKTFWGFNINSCA